MWCMHTAQMEQTEGQYIACTSGYLEKAQQLGACNVSKRHARELW
jgi:hypothetical protein